MHTKSTLQKLLVVIVLSIFLIVSSHTYASAQIERENELEFQNMLSAENIINVNMDVPGGPGYVMVSAFDFKPYNPEVDKATYVDASLTNAATESTHIASLTLPHGATVTQLILYFGDLAPVSNFTVTLFRASVDGAIEPIQFVRSSGANPGPRNNYMYLSSTIDNRNYSYYLNATFPAGTTQTLTLINVRIDYSYNIAAPLIMN